jgi:hypothetical protein
MRSNESIELSSAELQAAYDTQERLSQPDAHLAESTAADSITITSEPTILSGEELQADRDMRERLTTKRSPWLDEEQQ